MGSIFGTTAGVIQVHHPSVGLDRANKIINTTQFLVSSRPPQADVTSSRWNGHAGSTGERQRGSVVAPEFDPKPPGFKLGEFDGTRPDLFDGEAPGPDRMRSNLTNERLVATKSNGDIKTTSVGSSSRQISP